MVVGGIFVLTTGANSMLLVICASSIHAKHIGKIEHKNNMFC